jgi:hypothetical protein
MTYVIARGRAFVYMDSVTLTGFSTASGALNQLVYTYVVGRLAGPFGVFDV